MPWIQMRTRRDGGLAGSRREHASSRAALVAAAAVAAALAIGADVVSAAGPPAAKAAAPTKKSKGKTKFTMVSPDLSQGRDIPEAQVYNGFGCKGKGLSPELHWSGAPDGTKSFALMVHDPDAPTGSGFWHWVVYDIPADTDHLPPEAGDPKQPRGLPKGAVQGRNDFGTVGYAGPCPPPGKPHHYHFRLFALKVPKLEVPAEATTAMIGFYVNANKLAETDLMGTYGR